MIVKENDTFLVNVLLVFCVSLPLCVNMVFVLLL